jgi:hypothetical protein
MLTPLNLISLPSDEKVSLDSSKKAQMMKALYESVQQRIKKKNDQYATKANKGSKHVIF